MAQTRTLKDFKSLKNHDHKITKTIFVKDLIVGEHPVSYQLLNHLKEKNLSSQEEVKWVHQFDFMAPFDTFSLEGIRGQVAGELLREFYPTLELKEVSSVAKFYKDGEFKEFGGRVKPHEIPLHERYFMQKPWKYHAQNFWGNKSLFQNLSSHHVKGLINNISKLDAQLGARENWQVVLSDGTAYQCENLWVTYIPSRFLSLFEKQQADFFAPGFHQFSKTPEGGNPLAIKFQLKSEITLERGTLFIPQSQTHEWGSFIIEFSDDLKLTALLFMNANEADHEEIGKKIKLLKRVLDRVFDNFEKKIVNESISFAQNPVNYNLSDEVHGLTDFIPQLHFISELGYIPLKNQQVNSLQGLSRLIYLYKQSTI